GRVVPGCRAVLCDRAASEWCLDAGSEPQRPRTRRVKMLVEADLGRLIALIVGFHLCRLRHVSVRPLTRVDRVAAVLPCFRRSKTKHPPTAFDVPSPTTLRSSES